MRGRVVQQVAAETGTVSASYIYRLMKGVDQNPSITKLDAIARACGTNLGYFFEPWKQKTEDDAFRKKEDERAIELVNRALANESYRPVLLSLLEAFSPQSLPKLGNKGGPSKG